MRTSVYLLLAFLLLGLLSCEKEQEDFVTTDTQNINGLVAPVTINVYGRLLDNQGEVVVGARVVAGNKETVTDQFGIWRIDGARVGGGAGYITFQSPQHLPGSRTIHAREGSTYEVLVELLRRDQVYDIAASAGGTIDIAGSGATVTFPAAAFAKTDGTPFTGTARVIAHYMDPSLPQTYRQMPGDLRGLAEGADNPTAFSLLTSYGMMNIELEDANGNKLFLAADKRATLTFPIPPAYRSAAPASIPLWYFDDKGYWVEEGSANLVNFTYVGEVTHFTPYNVDVPLSQRETVEVCATLRVKSGTLLARSNRSYAVSVTGLGMFRTVVVTDEDGEICVRVPMGQVISFAIIDDCFKSYVALTAGPFSRTDSTLVLLFDPEALTAPYPLHVKGQVFCGDTPHGLVSVIARDGQSLNRFLPVTRDGVFDYTVFTCEPVPISLELIDGFTGRRVFYNVPFNQSNEVAAEINVCQPGITGRSTIRAKINGSTFVNGIVGKLSFDDVDSSRLTRVELLGDVSQPTFIARFADGLQLAAGSYRFPPGDTANHLKFIFSETSAFRYSLDGQEITIQSDGRSPALYTCTIGPVDLVRDEATVADNMFVEFRIVR